MTCKSSIIPQIQHMKLKLAKSTVQYGWTHGLCFVMMRSGQMLGDLIPCESMHDTSVVQFMTISTIICWCMIN
jgi:hypothetical protein